METYKNGKLIDGGAGDWDIKYEYIDLRNVKYDVRIPVASEDWDLCKEKTGDVIFWTESKYIEPPSNIHSNRGYDKQFARIWEPHYSDFEIGERVKIDAYENETFEVIGIRRGSLELYGDWSAMYSIDQADWYPIKKCRKIIK